MTVDVEEPTAQRAAADIGSSDAEQLTPAAPVDESPPEPTTVTHGLPVRPMIATLCTAAGAGVLAGGVFTDPLARVYAIAAALLGGLLAFGAHRIRNLWAAYAVCLGGLFVIGIFSGFLVSGADILTNMRGLVAQAVNQAHLVRPPIAITGGFAALLGWIMAAVGFVAVWAAVALRRPSLGLLLPLPVAVVAAISVSQTEQVVDGLVLVVLIIVGLAIIAGGRELSAGGGGLPVAFELRRAAKALPVIALGTAALFGIAQTGVLFPRPVVAPQYQAQRPHTEPLSQATDRVLFEVRSAISGPWVVGALDVYDGTNWLLPSIADQDLRDIPADGYVDRSLHPALDAVFTIRGQTGAVLPTLPNTVGILATGPRLAYDARSGNIRLIEGEIVNGFSYRVAAAGVPNVTELEKVNSWPAADNQYIQMPSAPSGVQGLIGKAPKSSRWAEWDYLRTWVLDNITAAGAGTPVSITPARVDEILRSKQASPYEIVAVETMLARWVGIPARIGYGFDSGTKVGDHLEVHPKDGSVFPEVFFPGQGWIPVLGQPTHAKVSTSSNPNLQQQHQGVLPSTDIAVTLFLAAQVPPASDVTGTVLAIIGVIVAVLAALGAAYLLYPAVAKLVTRSRRRSIARASGPRARISQAYCEWRDTLTDYGYRHPSDTPIMLLSRFPDDEDHAEFAWLVTRALWGDMQHHLDGSVATDAEELSSTLKRRLAQAHPVTVRLVAALSRLSLRDPYAVEHVHEKERTHAA